MCSIQRLYIFLLFTDLEDLQKSFSIVKAYGNLCGTEFKGCCVRKRIMIFYFTFMKLIHSMFSVHNQCYYVITINLMGFLLYWSLGLLLYAVKEYRKPIAMQPYRIQVNAPTDKTKLTKVQI